MYWFYLILLSKSVICYDDLKSPAICCMPLSWFLYFIWIVSATTHSYRIVEPNNDGLRRMFVYSGSNQVPCLFFLILRLPTLSCLGVWGTTIFFHTPQLIHSGFNKKNSALAWTCLKTTLWVKHPKNEENIFTIERCVYFGSVGLPSSSELAHQKLKRWTT